MSNPSVIVISDECTSSVVTIDRLTLFPNNTSNGGSDSREQLASGTSERSNLVKCVFVNTFDDIDFAVVRPVIADGPV